MYWNKIIFSCVFAMLYCNANAQDFYRNEWFVGILIQKIDFTQPVPKSFLLDNFPLDTNRVASGNSNICDSDGHILIATDGIKLYNGSGEFIVGGGENINNDSIVLGDGNDTAYPNSSIVLPKKNNQFYVFVSTMSDSKYNNYYNNGGLFDFDEVRYSVVDMNANNGKGQIIEKNKLLYHTDSAPWLSKSCMTACRHGNGRDWWLLKPSARERNIMHKFLVTSDTIEQFIQNLPNNFTTFNYDNIGQSCFSKDGSLYAECNSNTPHAIYDFDRCSGELSLKRVINLDNYQYKDFGDDKPIWTGVCFSPNNRFLYTSDYYNVYQIDLWEMNDSLAIKRVSKDTVYNITNMGFPKYFQMQLTPTNVIYLGNANAISPSVNGILFPDKLGDSCGFIFKYYTSSIAIDTNRSNTSTPPNMPFYGLGALVGSECDTASPPPPKEGLLSVVLPNAFSPNNDGLNDFFHILNVAKLQQEGVSFQEVLVFNRLGNKVFSSQDISFKWDGSKWANDTYFYYVRYKTKEGNNKVEKGDVVLIR